MSNIKKQKSQKKDQMVTIKCTSQQKKQLMQMAQQKDIREPKFRNTISEYVLEGALTGKEHQCRKNKIDTTQMVMQQENLNDMLKNISPDQLSVKRAWRNLAEEEKKKWVF